MVIVVGWADIVLRKVCQPDTMDRRQVVRQRVLVPSFAGSNPAGPAIRVLLFQKAFFRWGFGPSVRILPVQPSRKRRPSGSYFVAFVWGGRRRAQGSHRAKRGLGVAERSRHPAGPAKISY